MSPLVSVCIPTYNGVKYVLETLTSVLNQTYDNLEIIVSDDNSTDGTLEIVKKIKEKTKIPIYILDHKPNGIGANWNNTLRHANGEYIKFVFQDDVLEPSCIAEMVDAFKYDKKIKLVASRRKFIIESDSDNMIIKEWILNYQNLQQNLQNDVKKDFLLLDKSIFKRDDFRKSPLNKIGEPSVVLFKKSLINEVGWFNENLEQILDYEYWYRILKKNKILILKKELVSFRIHRQQATNVNRNIAINDYRLYDKILYKSYSNLLHENLRKELYNQYGFWPNFKRKYTRIVKKIIKGITNK